jgi:hypothetical protein
MLQHYHMSTRSKTGRMAAGGHGQLANRHRSAVHRLVPPDAPVPTGQKDHERIAVAIAVALGGFNPLVDLAVLEVVARPQLGIFQPSRRNYP